MIAFSYEASGLNIGSDFPFPELQVVDATEHHVLIKKRKVPDRLTDPSYSSRSVQLSDRQMLLDVEGVARFLVTDGREIDVDIYPGTSEDVVRLYLLSTVFSSILYKRSMLAVHASAVCIDDSAVMFSGASGAGKSTLALGFHSLGYKVLHDDISSVAIEEGVPHVLPGYRHLKLWPESIAKYNMDAGEFPRLRDGVAKYRFSIGETDRIKRPLKCIFILEITSEENIRFEQLSAFESVKQLMQNTFRPWLVEKLGKSGELFNMCSIVAGMAPVYKIYRPQNINAPAFVSYLLNLIKCIN